MNNGKFTAILALAEIDNTTIKEAERIFFAYKDNGIAKNGKFADNKWLLCDEYANYGFDFNIDESEFSIWGYFLGVTYEDFKNSFKAFIICKAGYFALGALRNVIWELKKVISSDLSGLSDIACNLPHVRLLFEFFSMLNVNNEDNRNALLNQLDDVCDILDYSSGNQRTLAQFESYFRFDDIVKRWWSECNDKAEKLFFFPIWLWWTVSGVVPMRPREFILTPRNCLTKNGDNYFLTIRKNKIKGSSKVKSYKISEDYSLAKYQIPNALAKEIEWYISSTADFNDTELRTLLVTDTHYIKWNMSRPYRSRYYTYANLSTCLRYFFNMIVKKRYGYNILFDLEAQFVDDKDIHYLHLGDTRHIALMNLIAEGSTPVVAMVLAGHDNLEMSSHYYSNIASMIECKTYRQYKKLINGKQNYVLSKPISALKVGDFTLLNDGSRCYYSGIKNGDYSQCYKVCGPAGEIGFCESCTYHRAKDMAFTDNKDKYVNRLALEFESLNNIIRKVRANKGDKEELTQALLRIHNADYSYQQYLLETMEVKNG